MSHQHVVAPSFTPHLCYKHEQFPAHGGGRVASQQLACSVLTMSGLSHVPPAGLGHEEGSGLSDTF